MNWLDFKLTQRESVAICKGKNYIISHKITICKYNANLCLLEKAIYEQSAFTSAPVTFVDALPMISVSLVCKEKCSFLDQAI